MGILMAALTDKQGGEEHTLGFLFAGNLGLSQSQEGPSAHRVLRICSVPPCSFSRAVLNPSTKLWGPSALSVHQKGDIKYSI